MLIALCFQITQDPSTFSHLRFKQRKYFSWQVISPTANQLATRVLDRSKSSILGMASRISLCVKPALLSRVSMRDTIFRFLNNLKEEETNFKFYFCLTSMKIKSALRTALRRHAWIPTCKSKFRASRFRTGQPIGLEQISSCWRSVVSSYFRYKCKRCQRLIKITFNINVEWFIFVWKIAYPPYVTSYI